MHIGSIAVPGLAAKPIIDLDAVVADRAAVVAAIDALTAAGAGASAHRDHVDLRDFSQAHPAQAARYAALKRRLAPLVVTDHAAYVQGRQSSSRNFSARLAERIPDQKHDLARAADDLTRVPTLCRG